MQDSPRLQSNDWLGVLLDINDDGMVQQGEIIVQSIDEEIIKYIEKQEMIDTSVDLLHYWFRRRNELPLLSMIARNILVIPASSSEIERKFSSFNSLDIITKKRNRLKKETVKDLMIVVELICKRRVSK